MNMVDFETIKMIRNMDLKKLLERFLIVHSKFRDVICPRCRYYNNCKDTCIAFDLFTAYTIISIEKPEDTDKLLDKISHLKQEIDKAIEEYAKKLEHELQDSIKEYQEGKAREFKNLQEAIEWLESGDEE